MDWRRTRLEIELAGLGRLTSEAETVDRRREQVEAERARAERSLVGSASVEAQQLAALDSFRTWAHHECARLHRLRADCEIKIAEQRQRVIEARRLPPARAASEKKAVGVGADFNRELESPPENSTSPGAPVQSALGLTAGTDPAPGHTAACRLASSQRPCSRPRMPGASWRCNRCRSGA
jgi:hypothetical protein